MIIIPTPSGRGGDPELARQAAEAIAFGLVSVAMSLAAFGVAFGLSVWVLGWGRRGACCAVAAVACFAAFAIGMWAFFRDL